MERLSAIDTAFTEYANSISKRSPEDFLQAREAINKAINMDVAVLTELFPCLCEVVGKPTFASTKLDPISAKHRFKFIFQMFVRSISAPSHPVVLFLDDLQWADEFSLEL
eukprot:9860653-Ditylum_brightwellii.AAC.1